MKTFVNALAWIVRRAPWAVILLTVVVSLGLGSFAGKFTPSEDANESFAPDAPELAAAERIAEVLLIPSGGKEGDGRMMGAE